MADAAQFHRELGLTCAAMGAHEAAVDSLREATRLDPSNEAAWRKLAELLGLAGDRSGAEAALRAASEARGRAGPPGQGVSAAKIDKAEQKIRALIGTAAPAAANALLRAHLMQNPTDFAALRMLAQLGLASGQHAAMERLLERALELAPSYITARQNYAFVLLSQNKARQAMKHIDRLLAHDPRERRHRAMRARALTILGDYDGAIAIFEAIRKEEKRPNAGFWLSYAHALRYAGRRDHSVRAYRECLALAPGMGDAYWGIATVKTEPFSASDIAAMRAHLSDPRLAQQDRIAMHYALGFALEQAGDYAGSFEHYAKGAALKYAQRPDKPDERGRTLRRLADFFTVARLGAVSGGCADPAPIFVVGMRRAGSTLIEQILASHSEVEGTQELPALGDVVHELAGAAGLYPECLAHLDGASLAALGERYLELARPFRKTGKRFFVDKMPSNWMHAGLIRMILPNAKIIDARRDPMATCFSGFRQYFGGGPSYSCDLAALGRYYRDYAALMGHFDASMPGRIHRVVYETMVGDTEDEIRRLLDYCGLAFEASCLRFWENRRGVGTPSAEQVRRPIYREGLDQWRHYEPWLAKLRHALEEPAGLPGSRDML
jgi:tetratricopeptide (TPR) repeat protein